MKLYELEPFGTARSGESVRAFRLEGAHVRAEVITYGAALRVFEIDLPGGRTVDAVLGYDTLEAYEQAGKYLGAILGRCANRIAGGCFTLDGMTYNLAKNDGNNHLHGGLSGFSDRVWQANMCTDGLHLTLESPDGDEGYPGNLRVDVIYRIEDNDALSISYRAVCDQDTVCNLSNHTYFNLAGAGCGDILSQKIQLLSDYYTPSDAESLPRGTVLPVEGTPMDLREPVAIGTHIDDGFVQLRQAGGYDHNWVVRGTPGKLRPAARALCEQSGVLLEAWTTQPGIQFYTSNFLAGGPGGKGGKPYPNRAAFCLEAQAFPNAVNCPSFPQPVLRQGSIYQQKTVYHLKPL